MNPSYKNGGTNIPGVKPGIISSGPDGAGAASPVNPVGGVASPVNSVNNTVNPVNPVNPMNSSVNPTNPTNPVNPAMTRSENPMAPTNPVVQTNPIAPTNPTTSANPMMQANPMINPIMDSSRQPTGGRPITSEMMMDEDIILDDDEPDNSKRKWIIAGVISGVVALIVAVVLAIAMSHGGGGSDDVRGVTGFNRLINYVTYGVESDTPVDARYDVFGDYYFVDVDEEYEEDEEDIEANKKAVYSRASELMTEFANNYRAKYGNSNTEKSERILVLADSTDDMIKFMNVIVQKGIFYDYEIVEMIEAGGTESAREQALAYYDFSGLDDNDYVTEFMEIYKNWVDASLSEANSDSKLESDVDAIVASDYYADLVSYYDMSTNFVVSIYNLNELIKTGSAMGDGDE